MKKLFTNNIEIRSDIERVTDVLINAFALSKWNYAISNITEVGADTFEIHRNGAALNKDEILTIKQNDDEIVYASKGGKLEYRLVFQLLQEDSRVSVIENFYTLDKLILPEPLIVPIAKNAFNQNLRALKHIIEA